MDISQEIQKLYGQTGISPEVHAFGEQIEKSLKERFDKIDKMAELNQLKVIHAMQEARVNAECFNYASGYGYNDFGRDTLYSVIYLDFIYCMFLPAALSCRNCLTACR